MAVARFMRTPTVLKGCTTAHLSGTKSSVSNALICTAGRRNPANASTIQGSRKGDLVLLRGLVEMRDHRPSTLTKQAVSSLTNNPTTSPRRMPGSAVQIGQLSELKRSVNLIRESVFLKNGDKKCYKKVMPQSIFVMILYGTTHKP